MAATLVLQLSDGEELVVEGLPDRCLLEDPRDLTIEVRRLALQRLDAAEERSSERRR